jgi:hypothetical protein
VTLPTPVLEYLREEAARTLSPACVLVGRDGRVLEVAGALERYGLDRLAPGQDAVSRAPVLHGLLPLRGGVLILPKVALGSGAHADLHLVPGVDGDWIILLDASREASAWRRIQQIHNERTLRLETEAGGDRSDVLAESLPGTLGIAALERLTPRRFRLIGPPPSWLERLGVRPDAEGVLDPAAISAFVGHFLEDAERFWDRPGTSELSSGLWVETDARHYEWTLEATAVVLCGRPVLLVAWHPNRYAEARLLQQGLRDKSLHHERLTGETQKKELLLHHIIHDLKQPLTAVEGVLAAIDTGALTVDDANLVELGQQQAARLRDQIGGLLAAFHADIQAMDRVAKDRHTAPDPVAVADTLVRTFGPAFARRRVTLTGPDEGAAGGARVVADRAQLERVIGNLLENALRFAPEDSAVRLGVVRTAAVVEVAVEDEGPGVAPDVAPQLFRSAEFGPLVTGRSGLGLAYCRTMVERWGGRMGYAPRTPTGARFWVRLPVAGDTEAGGA